MECVGGALIPDWLPDWLVPWLAQSQGMTMCGVEWLMLLEMVLLLPVLLYLAGHGETPADPKASGGVSAG